MRIARMLPFLIIAQVGWAMGASGQASPTPDVRPLTIMPTAIEELTEFRMNTGTKAVLNDGTLSAVYVTHVPATGCTYLNFHVDVASETGVCNTRSTRLSQPIERLPSARLSSRSVSSVMASGSASGLGGDSNQERRSATRL